MAATESITYRELVRELKTMVERDNLEGLVDYLEAYQESDIPWDTLFKDIYVHACLKKQQRIVDWLVQLYEKMPPIQKIALRQIFAYGRHLLGKTST
jgi:hypothetical protein